MSRPTNQHENSFNTSAGSSYAGFGSFDRSAPVELSAFNSSRNFSDYSPIRDFGDGDRSPDLFEEVETLRPGTMHMREKVQEIHNVKCRLARKSRNVIVNPKSVFFCSGLNFFTDEKYEYCVRVDHGITNLSESPKPFELEIFLGETVLSENSEKLFVCGDATTDEDRGLDQTEKS